MTSALGSYTVFVPAREIRSGFVKELDKYVDLYLLDIKHIDTNKCKDLVGCGNEKELAFARYLSDNNIDMWIRQVIVPGFTDDENEVRIVFKRLKNLSLNIDKSTSSLSNLIFFL